MMMMKRSHLGFFMEAYHVSKTSNHSKHTHGCVSVVRNSIVSKGANIGSLHAEVNSLRKCQHLKEASRVGLTVFVCRVNKMGEFRDSRPCERCQKFMKRWGISKVFYTKNGGEIEMMRL